MANAEKTSIGGPQPPTPEMLADPVAQLSMKYIGFLRDAHPLIYPDNFEPTPEWSNSLDETIEEIIAAVPNINERSLRKMVSDNPVFNRGWLYGGDATEFHVLATFWEDDFWSGNRNIAERQYELTEIEVDFLRRGADILPPPPRHLHTH